MGQTFKSRRKSATQTVDATRTPKRHVVWRVSVNEGSKTEYTVYITRLVQYAERGFGPCGLNKQYGLDDLGDKGELEQVLFFFFLFCSNSIRENGGFEGPRT